MKLKFDYRDLRVEVKLRSRKYSPIQNLTDDEVASLRDFLHSSIQYYINLREQFIAERSRKNGMEG